jgi:hypothetical protein
MHFIVVADVTHPVAWIFWTLVGTLALVCALVLGTCTVMSSMTGQSAGTHQPDPYRGRTAGNR